MQDINLYSLIKFYFKNWLTVVVILSISFILGIVYNNFLQTPLFKSDATLLLVRSNISGTQDVSLLNNYIELFKSRRVLEPVIKDQKIDMSYDNFIQYVEVNSEKNTDVMKISVATNNPDVSKKFVEQAVVSFKKNAKDLYSSDNIQVVDDASFSNEPYNVHKELVLTVTTLTGLLISTFSLFLIYDYRQSKMANLSDGKKDKASDIKTELSAKEADKVTDTTPQTPINTNPVADNNQPATYEERAAWARAVYSRERQIRR